MYVVYSVLLRIDNPTKYNRKVFLSKNWFDNAGDAIVFLQGCHKGMIVPCDQEPNKPKCIVVTYGLVTSDCWYHTDMIYAWWISLKKFYESNYEIIIENYEARGVVDEF